jgi:hypothetical protein
MQGIDLKPVYAKISRKLEQILQGQAPVDTGNLKSQVVVTYDEAGFTISVGNAQYGIYLHEGTGMEESTGAGSNFASAYLNMTDFAFNPRPGEGEGGIKPRYWMNFSDTVYEMINDEISAAYAEAMNEIIQQELESI